MKRLMFLFFPVICFAQGELLNYDAAYTAFADGDTFFTDVNYKPPHDSARSIINGRLGNVNLASDANIDGTKIDTTSDLNVNEFICDSITVRKNIIAENASMDSAAIGYLNPDSIAAFTLNGNIDGGDNDFTNINKINTDTVRVKNELILGVGNLPGITMPYEMTNPSNKLELRYTDTGEGAEFNMFSKDGDGTDDVVMKFYGVGTVSNSSPRSYLQVGYASSGSQMRIQSVSSGATPSDPLHIYVKSNGNQLVLDSAGNVGINQQIPTEKLHVNGNLQMDGVIQYDSATAVLSSNEVVSTDITTSWIKLDTEGSVALDTLSTVSGTPTIGTYVIFQTANDARDILIIDAGGEFVMNSPGEILLSNTLDKVVFLWTGSEFVEISRSIDN